jgi:hypothetical protein
MINLRRIFAATAVALSIAGTAAAPVAAQHYYYYPAPQGSGYNPPETYTTPGGWGERGSNGWTYHPNGDGFYMGRDSNGCVYTPDWSNC